MLMADIDPAGVPPLADLAHGGQEYLVDGAVESQRLAGDIQGPSDAVRGQIASALEERVDQRTG